MPRKLSPASTRIAEDTPSVASTMVEGMVCGRTWRSMMRPLRAPIDRAAVVYSISRCTSASALVLRANAIHWAKAMTTTRFRTPPPMMAMTARASSTVGMASTASAKRMKATSTQPRRYPVSRPTATPATIPAITAERLISSEVRVPSRMRAKTSRPSESVPSRWSPPAQTGGVSRPTRSCSVDASPWNRDHSDARTTRATMADPVTRAPFPDDRARRTRRVRRPWPLRPPGPRPRSPGRRSGNPDAWVHGEVGEVHEQADQHHEEGDDHGDGLHHGVVANRDGLDGQ